MEPTRASDGGRNTRTRLDHGRGGCWGVVAGPELLSARLIARACPALPWRGPGRGALLNGVTRGQCLPSGGILEFLLVWGPDAALAEFNHHSVEDARELERHLVHIVLHDRGARVPPHVHRLASATSGGILGCIIVGATGRLLNFFWPGGGAGAVGLFCVLGV